MKKLNLTLLLLVVMLTTAMAQQLAFPGAQGFGRFATGGRNGSVYHVTNLNDSGTGSFRDAVSQPNRIVVFDVAGVININSRIVFAKNLYVAGQTAPGEGITIYGNGVSFTGASNSIFRYLRIRMGKGGDSGKDCAGIANGTNMIFDHCSFAWGLDETFSINPSSNATISDITLMNCIVGQGLLTHSAGGLMQADNITLYRNFYCDNSTRNNKVKGKHQYVNNIVYNWSSGCYIMGGDSNGSSYANTTGNLFINGPSGGGNAMTGANADFHIYVKDNWQDRNKDGQFNPYEIPNSELSGGPTIEANPFDYPELEEVSATSLIENSLPTVGASLPYRDYVDCYMVDECLSFGKKGMLISTESILPYGVPSSWNVWKGNTRIDTDNDGMPDEWENANGTDPNKNDAMTIAANGYANIENYINSISRDSRDFFLRAPICLAMAESTQSSITLEWADYTDNEEGFIVEKQDGGNWTEIGRTTAATFTVNDLPTPAAAYTFRVCAYMGEEKSEYATVTGKTQPEQIDLVDINNFNSEYHDFENGKDILINTDVDLTKTLSEAVTPNHVVVLGKGNVTIDGTGSIGGAASMNKGGEGNLTLSTTNSYTGPTVLHDGTISFPTLKNGGVASSIGASQEFAQYWVWNGGTWNYTGGSTSTNRSANVLKPTRFCIADAAAEVKMSGVLQGGGGLILAGKGKLTPSSSSFFGYDGETRLEGGTLYLNGVSTMWSDKQCHLGSRNKLVLAGGSLETRDANDTYSTYDFDIETVRGTISTLSFSRNCSIRCKVYGEGDIRMKVNYLREYIRGDWSGFTGRLYATSTSGKVGENQLMFDTGFEGIKNGVIELEGTNTQINCWKSNGTAYIGGLAGCAGTYLSGFGKNDKSGGTWVVGGAGTDETFNGVIDNRQSANNYNCTVNIVKEGEGYWRLNGNNVYAGTTKVNAGTLIVNGKHSGTGAYTVGDEATLAGKGSIAGAVTVNNGGTLRAGDDKLLDAKTLTINGKLTMNSGSRMVIPVACHKEKASSTSMEEFAASALWAHDTDGGNTATAAYSADGVFKSSNYTYDSGVSVDATVGRFTGGDGSVPDIPVTWYKCASAETFSISYIITPNTEFKPNKLSAFMLRYGTDAMKVDVKYQIGNGEAVVVSEGITPRRNTKAAADDAVANAIAEYSADLNNVVVPAGTAFKVTFTCTCAKSKKFGLSNVKIDGTYEKEVTNYDPDKLVCVTQANRLVLNGAAAVSGATLELDMTEAEIDALEDGAAFQLFVPSTTVSGQFSEIIPAVPTNGFVWDTTDLYSKGVLKVVADPAAIHSVSGDNGAKRKSKGVYSLDGQRVSDNAKGIVVKDGKKVIAQ